MNSLDTCLASQEIRMLIKNNILVAPNFDESKIQPSSFEPTIGNEVFILDTEGGLFRPQEDQTIYRTLLELPKKKKAKSRHLRRV